MTTFAPCLWMDSANRFILEPKLSRFGDFTSRYTVEGCTMIGPAIRKPHPPFALSSKYLMYLSPSSLSSRNLNNVSWEENTTRFFTVVPPILIGDSRCLHCAAMIASPVQTMDSFLIGG